MSQIEITRRAVEAQANDTRTEAEIIADGAAFVLGEPRGEASEAVAQRLIEFFGDWYARQEGYHNYPTPIEHSMWSDPRHEAVLALLREPQEKDDG